MVSPPHPAKLPFSKGKCLSGVQKPKQGKCLSGVQKLNLFTAT